MLYKQGFYLILKHKSTNQLPNVGYLQIFCANLPQSIKPQFCKALCADFTLAGGWAIQWHSVKKEKVL
jgi:hypothetical protein